MIAIILKQDGKTREIFSNADRLYIKGDWKTLTITSPNATGMIVVDLSKTAVEIDIE
jgi:hypothetical protein